MIMQSTKQLDHYLENGTLAHEQVDRKISTNWIAFTIATIIKRLRSLKKCYQARKLGR